MTPMPTALLIELRNTFVTFFTEEELRDLALALGVDYENISGSNKSAKARELATYLWRRSLLTKLAEMGPALYPDIPWHKILVDYLPPAATTGPAVADTSHKLTPADLNQVIAILDDYSQFDSPSGRKTILFLAGLDGIINIDLNGSAFDFASNLAVKLNEYGKTREGDFALGRLLAQIARDEALPPSQKETLDSLVTKYGLKK
jgi:hypothetical protein